MKYPLIIVAGPTAIGKSDLAVELALRFGGEVISADSRQVYRGLDIGTGKITTSEMKGIPHHLLDVCDPNERFTVSDWKSMAEKAISDIRSRGRVPIICGGTGFYISALIDGLILPEVEADPEEQALLESKPAADLYAELQALDPRRASQIDPNNKRRLARAILIARELGSVPEVASKPSQVIRDSQVIFIGVILPDEEMKRRIEKRLIKRLDIGMVEEAKSLHEGSQGRQSLSYERMDELGLEYRYLAQLLQGKSTREQFIETLGTKIWQYARRQKTWFKRDKRIRWFSPAQFAEIEQFVRDSLESK